MTLKRQTGIDFNFFRVLPVAHVLQFLYHEVLEREREFQVKPLAVSTCGSPCGQRAFQEQSEALAMSRMQLTTTVLAKHMQLRRLAANEAAADAWHNPDLAGGPAEQSCWWRLHIN